MAGTWQASDPSHSAVVAQETEGAADPSVADLRAAYLHQVTTIHSLEVHYFREHSDRQQQRARAWYRQGDSFRHTEQIADLPITPAMQAQLDQLAGQDGGLDWVGSPPDGVVFDGPPTDDTPADDGTSDDSSSEEAGSDSVDGAARQMQTTGFCHDDKFYYNLIFEGERLSDIQVRETLPEVFEYNLVPDLWLGLDILGTTESLAEILAHPECKVVGSTTQNGSECWHIQGPALTPHPSVKNRLHVFLDAEHDYLPCRILIVSDDIEVLPDSSHGEWYQDLVVEEFRKIPDESSGSDRWFPARFSMKQAAVRPITAVVENAVINRELPQHLFTPELTDGTEVLDLTAAGKGKVYIGTSKESIGNLIADVSAQANQMSPDGRSSFPWYFLVINGVVVLALGIWVTFRRLRTGPS